MLKNRRPPGPDPSGQDSSSSSWPMSSVHHSPPGGADVRHYFTSRCHHRVGVDSIPVTCSSWGVEREICCHCEQRMFGNW